MTGHEPYADLPDEEVTIKFGLGVFPDTEALKFGKIIKDCWAREFERSEDTLEAILADGLMVT